MNSPQGLNKDQVIARLSEYYEMGNDESWKKSVTQLLSSHKDFIKKKGTYRLNFIPVENKNHFIALAKTFKDRVFNCLLQCENYEADLKRIAEVYLDLYGLQEGYQLHET